MTIKTPYKSEIIEEIKVNTLTIDGKVDVVDGLVDTLNARLTSSRAGYLDNINNSNLATLPAISSARVGYLDNLSGGAVALNSTVAKEATLTHATYGLDKIKTETASLVSKVDVIDGIVDLIKVETDKIANATYGLSALNTDLDSIIASLANATYGLSALKTLIDTVDSVADAIKLKTDLLSESSTSLVEHSITTGNDKVETEVEEIEDSGNYSLSLFFDFDSLESAGEGGLVTIKLYNKIDDSNYSDSPIAISEYFVGVDTEYPSFEAQSLSGYSKITILCSDDVTSSRTVYCKIVKRNM